MASLNLATTWRHLHQLQIWPTDAKGWTFSNSALNFCTLLTRVSGLKLVVIFVCFLEVVDNIYVAKFTELITAQFGPKPKVKGMAEFNIGQHFKFSYL